MLWLWVNTFDERVNIPLLSMREGYILLLYVRDISMRSTHTHLD